MAAGLDVAFETGPYVLDVAVVSNADGNADGVVSEVLRLSFDTLGVGSSTRSVILFSYLLGVVWNKPPNPSDTVDLCGSIAARVARRFCRAKAPELLRDCEKKTDFLRAHAFMFVERTGTKATLRAHLSFGCVNGTALDVRHDSEGSCAGVIPQRWLDA